MIVPFIYLNIPYGQSSAKLPVTRSFGHLVIRSLGHSVTWSLGHLVTPSLGHLVTQSYDPNFQHCYELTNYLTTLGLTGLLRRQKSIRTFGMVRCQFSNLGHLYHTSFCTLRLTSRSRHCTFFYFYHNHSRSLQCALHN